MYKTKLNNQAILSANVITLVEGLQEGSLTILQLTNKKAYAKRVGKLLEQIECTIAFEIYQGLK